MNKLLKAKKGYKGGIKGTKHVPYKAAGAGPNKSQKVASGVRYQHALAGNSNSSKSKKK